MELRQRVYFVAVVENKHFSRAEGGLYISRPTVTLAIKGLERELGAGLPGGGKSTGIERLAEGLTGRMAHPENQNP